MRDQKVLCFGELLLRMSPGKNGGWIQENNMPVYVGGAELNVATALAKWNIPSKYFTALPNYSLSQDLIINLQEKNIDVSSINFSGNRIGTYFLEQGSDVKNADIIYDRMHTSFSELTPGMIDWKAVLEEVSWVHISAINPALNKNAADVCLELLKAASARGITISLDLNYRANFWRYGKNPIEVMSNLAQYCDLIMGNIWAADDLLGVAVDENILKNRSKTSCIEHAQYTSEILMKNFPKVKHVANTFRFDKEDNSINYYSTLCDKNKLYLSSEIHAIDIKDKIGSGDCFMAGLIYGFYNHMDPDKTINFAAAAAVGKMYEISDATNQTVQSVLLNATKNRAM